MGYVNLLFDLTATQPIDQMKRHGGGKYAESIFFRMVERNISFSCFYNSCIWINPLIIEAVKKNNVPLFDVKDIDLEILIKEKKITRVYSAIPGHNIASLSCCEVIGTVHDLRFLELPYDNIYYRYSIPSIKEKLKFFVKSCIPKYAKKKLIKSYSENIFSTGMKIITDSYHSKYAMLSYFPNVKERDICVFYAPNTSSTTPAQKTMNKEKYILSVSGNVWSKNVLRSIIAFDRLVSEGLVSELKYKVTGAKVSDFRYNIKNPSFFDFLGYVDDMELEELYANAYLFVYPSHSEGFGYPPLEAMRYGVPVIASPFTSISEILENGALYFNPFNIEEIMNRMLMITNDNYHEDFSQRGYNQFLKVKERQDRDLDSLIDYITQG